MRRVILGLLAAGAIAGCGGGGASSEASKSCVDRYDKTHTLPCTDNSAVPAAGGSATSTGPSPAEKAAKAQAAYEKCDAAFSHLLAKLGELDSRLDVGLNYDEYTNKVGDVKVAYDNAPFKQMHDIDCIGGVGVSAEKALNEHATAASVWGDCFEDVNCDNDSIQPELQRHWSRASRLTSRAKRNLERIKTPR